MGSSTRVTAMAGPLRRSAWKEIILGCQTQSADCVVSNIFKAVAEHAAGVDPFDDQTVVAIRIKDGAGGPGKRK